MLGALLLALSGAAGPAELVAQADGAGPRSDVFTLRAPITERYRAGGMRRWLLGDGYRAVWETPIPIDVLDFRTAGRGLVPVETGGYGQTVSLELEGRDGLEYAVRSVDKDPTRRLESRYHGTIVADIVQDQVAQFLPTAGLVVDPLLDATGILHPRHALVVIPDATELGTFRSRFVGLIGMFTDRPDEGPDDTPGFAGSTRIVGTEKLLDELEEGGCDEVDDRGYLKARLMDLVIGDRDRHEGQWRWARFPAGEGCWVWRSIPEDRDQAFIRNDGILMGVYRLFQPQQVAYGPEYPDLAGLTFNGWEVDREILEELDEPAWVEVAEEIRSELTDEVIDGAVARLPEEHRALVGDFLAGSLKARRDGVVDQARDYYALLAGEADVKATDRSEHAAIEHLDDGGLRLTIRYLDGPGSEAPHFERTYRAGVTREVRVYLRGGDDLVTIDGDDGAIEVRVVGGGGDDVLINTSRAGAGDTHFYDDRGANRVDGPVDFDDRRYERPAATNQAHRHALDWGGRSRYLPSVSFDRELGLMVGASLDHERYGFRADPTKSEHALRAAIVSEGPAFLVGWDALYREVALGGDLVLSAQYSGLEVLRFYGFGAGTVGGPDHEQYEVIQRELSLSPGLEWSWRKSARFGVAPIFKYSHTPVGANGGRYIASLTPAPLGFGRFAQLGGRAWVEVDTRDNPAYPTSGVRLRASSEAYPELLDAVAPFGRVEGRISTYWTPDVGARAPTFAVRVGGSRALGAFPFHEASFLGGRRDLSGTREQRYAGEGALFGEGEMRVPVWTFDLLFPTELGLTGAAEAGRVFHHDDRSTGAPWQRGFGGGLWLSFLDREQTLSVMLMKGRERLGVHIGGGFHF